MFRRRSRIVPQAWSGIGEAPYQIDHRIQAFFQAASKVELRCFQPYGTSSKACLEPLETGIVRVCTSQVEVFYSFLP